MEASSPTRKDGDCEFDLERSESETSNLDECMNEGDVNSLSVNVNVVTELPCDIVGKRSYEISGTTFTVDEKYRLVKIVGVGAYGVVIAAEDTNTGEHVALKRISGVFDDLTDAKRILREIRLMQALDHENVCKVHLCCRCMERKHRGLVPFTRSI